MSRSTLRHVRAIPVNITKDEIARLEELATAEGLSRNAVMRAALAAGLAAFAATPGAMAQFLPEVHVRRRA